MNDLEIGIRREGLQHIFGQIVGLAILNCTEKIRWWYFLEDESEGKTMAEKRARRTYSEEQKNN